MCDTQPVRKLITLEIIYCFMKSLTTVVDVYKAMKNRLKSYMYALHQIGNDS